VKHKKAVCIECRYCDSTTWRLGPLVSYVCQHPKRRSQHIDYMSGERWNKTAFCHWYNDCGQCKIFAPKPVRLSWWQKLFRGS
jgi:hypothetical protein